MAILQEPLNLVTRSLLVLAALVLLVSLLLAAFISRSIARPLQAIAATADQLGQGQEVAPLVTGLAEADAIGAAFTEAAQKITDRETLLRKSEMRYRQALEVGKIGSWETDYVRNTRHWSREAMTIFGLTLPEGVGVVGGCDDEWRSAVDSSNKDVLDEFETKLLIQDDHDAEYSIRRSDGTIVFLHGHGRVVERDAGGRPLRTINVIADISSRRQAEKTLQATEAKLGAIIAYAPVGIVMADAKGAIYSGNARAEAMFGHTILHSPDKDSYGEWISYHADGSRIDSHEYPLARALAGEEHPSLDVRYQRPDGTRIWLSLIGAVVRDEADHIVGALVAVMDIDAERRATQELAILNAELEQREDQALAEQRLLADVMNHTAMFIHIIGLDWRWMAINQAAAQEFARIYGVTPKVGDNLRELLKTKIDHCDRVEAVWTQALSGNDSIETVELGNTSSNRRTYEMRTYALRDADGQQIGAYQFVTDISEQLIEQRKLNQLQKMETIGQLTGNVAHDFNNLLSAILSNLEIARKRVDNLQTSKLIESAIQGAERGATLTGRLLAFARRQELTAQAVDLGTLIQGMEELLIHALGGSVKLEVDIPTELSPVMIDANQLELALLNLAVNARDASTQGGGSVTISASEHKQIEMSKEGLQPGLYVGVHIKDTGHGMDKATLKRAIEPFFTTKGLGKGTGLDLSMVHGLAVQSGGAMHIASAIGEGTTISVYLPIAADSTIDTPKIEAIKTPDSTSHGRVILVVDDDVLVGMGTASMLEDLGHTVLEAYSGKIALEVLAERLDIDLVVTDYSMPGMTGVELAEQVRVQRPGMPIILATGYADLPNGQMSALPRLAKPFRQQNLADIITKVINSNGF